MVQTSVGQCLLPAPLSVAQELIDFYSNGVDCLQEVHSSGPRVVMDGMEPAVLSAA